jgi:Ca-activated chloride channel homolog
MTKLKTRTKAARALAACIALLAAGEARAMTCDEAMAALAGGEGVAAVTQRLVRDGGITAGTVKCLVDRGAPPSMVAAARAMLAVPRPVEAIPAAAPAPAPEPPVRAHRRPSPRPPSASPAHRPPPPPPPPIEAYRPSPGSTESYTDHGVNPFTDTRADRHSTFAVDVDAGSYTMARRKLRQGYLPPEAAVRVEEFVNYLPYEYARPEGRDPFGVDVEVAPHPWHDNSIVRVGVQGRRVLSDRRKPVHLTFLVDTSGSMQSPDKIGLVKQSLEMLTERLEDGDTVALVVYAGSAGMVLAPTPIHERAKILSALAGLEAGGSTAMGAGIQLAYDLADQAYQEGAVNRVILASDGDANVGPTDHGSLSELIRGYAERGITLTTLGFGEGNYRDTTMEQIADDGDGNYFYLDSEREAQRVLVERMTSTLEVIAKDVKIQVAFSPEHVRRYRLIGYENRDVADRDFRDDAVDGGEIGSGHQVTALYEVEWSGAPGPLGTISIRNKAPGPDSRAVERNYALDPTRAGPSGSAQLRMAVASATFAEILRASQHVEGIRLADVHRLARGAARAEYPEDAELVELIEAAMRLRGEAAVSAR